MKKNKLIGIFALIAMMGLSGCNIALGETCIHKWSPWTVTVESTCRNKGQRTRYCTLCDKEQVRSMPIDTMYGHKPVANPDGDVEATCTTNGVTGSQKCLLCGLKIKGSSTDLKGHTWAKNTQATDDKYKEPTCLHDGLYQNKCTVCGETEDIVESALGHDDGAIDNSGGILHKVTCKRAGCGEVLGYQLNISEATGFNTPRTKMNAKSGASSMSSWNISSFVGSVIEPGFYDIQLEAAMTDASHGTRKMYNMANSNLQVEGDASANTANTDSPDKTTESDYRYYLQVDATDNYNPTTKKSFSELGLQTGTTSFNFVEFVNGVEIDEDTQTITLRHGNIGFSLYCNSLRLKPHTHKLTKKNFERTSSTVPYTIEECSDCGFKRLTINALDGAISGGKNSAGPNGYLGLPANNDSVSYKFNLNENLSGKVYVIGRQDTSKMNQSPYDCSWTIGSEEIAGADKTKLASDLLEADGSDLANYSKEGKVYIGNATLKDTSFGTNEIKYERLDDNNMVISKIVFEGRSIGHLHNYLRKASEDKAATCKANKQEYYECSCGLGKFVEVPDSKSDHTYVDTIVYEGSCDDPGEIEHVCSVCRNRWIEYIPKAHTLGEATSNPLGYTNKACTEADCVFGGEATWKLTQDMIKESTDGTAWADSTTAPVGQMDGMSMFKFDNTKYRKVTLSFQNDGDETDGVLRLFATTLAGDAVQKTQPYKQTIGEATSTPRFNLNVNGDKVSYDSKYSNLSMHDLGLENVASSVSDNGALANAKWINFYKINLSKGLNVIELETANLVGYNMYIGGFQLSY